MDRSFFIRLIAAVASQKVISFGVDPIFIFFREDNQDINDLESVLRSFQFANINESDEKTARRIMVLTELYRISAAADSGRLNVDKEKALQEFMDKIEHNPDLTAEDIGKYISMLGGLTRGQRRDRDYLRDLISTGTSFVGLGVSFLPPPYSMSRIILPFLSNSSKGISEYVYDSNPAKIPILYTGPHPNWGLTKAALYNEISKASDKSVTLKSFLDVNSVQIALGTNFGNGVDKYGNLPPEYRNLLQNADKLKAELLQDPDYLKRISQELVGLSEKTDKLGDNVEKLLLYFKKADAEAEKQKEKEEKRIELEKEYQKNLKEMEGAITIATFFLGKIMGKPNEAKVLYGAYGAIMSAYSTIAQYSKGDIGSLALSGNLLTIGVGLTQLFGGQPDVNQIIFEKLNQISEKIDALREYLTERLDRIEEQQYQIYVRLNDVYKVVVRNQQLAEQILKEVKEGFTDIKISLALESYYVAESEFQKKLSDAISLFYTYESIENEQNAKLDYLILLNYFYGFAIYESSKPAIAGDKNFVGTHLEQIKAIAHEIRTAKNVENLFAMIPLICRQFKADLNLPADARIPNPRFWAFATTAYFNCKSFYPETDNEQVIQQIRKLWETGSLIQKIFFGCTDKELLERLSASYSGNEIEKPFIRQTRDFISKLLQEISEWAQTKLFQFSLGIVAGNQVNWTYVFLKISNNNFYFLPGPYRSKAGDRIRGYNIFDRQHPEIVPKELFTLLPDPLDYLTQKGIVTKKLINRGTVQFAWNRKKSFQQFHLEFEKGPLSGITIGGEHAFWVEEDFFSTELNVIVTSCYWTSSDNYIIKLKKQNFFPELKYWKIRGGSEHEGTGDILNLFVFLVRQIEDRGKYFEAQGANEIIERTLNDQLNLSAQQFDDMANICRLIHAINRWTMSPRADLLYESSITNAAIIFNLKDLSDSISGLFSNSFLVSEIDVLDFGNLYRHIDSEETEVGKLIKDRLSLGLRRRISSVIKKETDDNDTNRGDLLRELNTILKKQIPFSDHVFEGKEWTSNEILAILTLDPEDEISQSGFNRTILSRFLKMIRPVPIGPISNSLVFNQLSAFPPINDLQKRIYGLIDSNASILDGSLPFQVNSISPLPVNLAISQMAAFIYSRQYPIDKSSIVHPRDSDKVSYDKVLNAFLTDIFSSAEKKFRNYWGNRKYIPEKTLLFPRNRKDEFYLGVEGDIWLSGILLERECKSRFPVEVNKKIIFFESSIVLEGGVTFFKGSRGSSLRTPFYDIVVKYDLNNWKDQPSNVITEKIMEIKNQLMDKLPGSFKIVHEESNVNHIEIIIGEIDDFDYSEIDSWKFKYPDAVKIRIFSSFMPNYTENGIINISFGVKYWVFSYPRTPELEEFIQGF